MGNLVRVVELGSKITKFLYLHRSEISLVGGCVAGGIGLVTACIATVKSKEYIDENKEKLEELKDKIDESEDEKELNENRKNYISAVTRIAGRVARNYIAPVGFLGLSAFGIFYSDRTLRIDRKILSERNTAFAMTAAGLTDELAKYKKDISEKLGEEDSQKLFYGLDKVEINDEAGEKKEVLVRRNSSDTQHYSPYLVIFDENNPNWSDDSFIRKKFLLGQLGFWQNKLKERKFVYLNEVYAALGFPLTAYGQLVGWRYDENDPLCDNKIDFGIVDIYREDVRDFMNGYAPEIILDFNVEPILDRVTDDDYKEAVKWIRGLGY